MAYGIGAYQKAMKKPPADGLSKRKANESEMQANESKTESKTAQSSAKTKGFVKETAVPPESKYRRVAKFLILIGPERAQNIIKNLDFEQVEAISREIAAVGTVNKTEEDALFAEFNALFRQTSVGGTFSTNDTSPFGGGTSPVGGGTSPVGGVAAARQLLNAAFGAEKADDILLKALPRDLAAAESNRRYFSFMQNYSVEQISFLLYNESTATAALILSRLPPEKSAAVIAAATSSAWQRDVALRIAKMGEVSPEVLESVSETLRRKAQKIGRQEGKDIAVDGLGALTAILRAGDFSLGESIMRDISGEDADLARSLQQKLYTADDVCRADDRRIAEKLREMDNRAIALLLKSAPLDNEADSAFRDKILSNISSGRRAAVTEEAEIMGSVPKKEIAAARNAFMEWFRRGVLEGEIVLAEKVLGEDD